MESKQDVPGSPGRWMRRLGRREFGALMGACIESVLLGQAGFTSTDARRVRWATLQRFDGMLNTRTRRVRGLTRAEVIRELERTHGALLRDRLEQAQELAGLEHALAGLRAPAPPRALDPLADAELDEALRADLAALLTEGSTPEAVEGLVARQRERREAALSRALEAERERIDQLERRIAKLRAAQREMELALAELARRAELDGGLPSIYRSVQGLALDEPARQAKAEMLRDVYEQNLLLQRRCA